MSSGSIEFGQYASKCRWSSKTHTNKRSHRQYRQYKHNHAIYANMEQWNALHVYDYDTVANSRSFFVPSVSFSLSDITKVSMEWREEIEWVRRGRGVTKCKRNDIHTVNQQIYKASIFLLYAWRKVKRHTNSKRYKILCERTCGLNTQAKRKRKSKASRAMRHTHYEASRTNDADCV